MRGSLYLRVDACTEEPFRNHNYSWTILWVTKQGPENWKHEANWLKSFGGMDDPSIAPYPQYEDVPF